MVSLPRPITRPDPSSIEREDLVDASVCRLEGVAISSVMWGAGLVCECSRVDKRRARVASARRSSHAVVDKFVIWARGQARVNGT